MADDIGTTGARVRFASANRHLVEVRYSGTTRVVEPHDYGIQNGRERLLVFQLRGVVRPGPKAIGWRLLEVSKIERSLCSRILSTAAADSRMTITTTGRSSTHG